MFQHYRAVAEFLDKAIATLNRCIRDFCNFVAVVAIPAVAGSGFDKINDPNWIIEVDESITDVAVVCKVDAEVHKVVLAKAGLVDNVFEHCLETINKTPKALSIGKEWRQGGGWTTYLVYFVGYVS